MSNLPISSKYRSLPDAAITEADRDDFTRRLNDEFARGTITQDDYSGLLDRVFSARTNGDLLPVAEALPARPTFEQPAIVAQNPSGSPGQLAPIRDASRLAVWTAAGAGVLAVLLVVLLVLVL